MFYIYVIVNMFNLKPSDISFSDPYVGGREVSREEWEERYGEDIERERKAGRGIFGVNFDHC